MPTNDKPTPGGRPAAGVRDTPDPAVRESAAFSLLAAVVLREALGAVLADANDSVLEELLAEVLEASLNTDFEAQRLADLVGGDAGLLEARASRHIQDAIRALLAGAPWAAGVAIEPVTGAIA